LLHYHLKPGTHGLDLAEQVESRRMTDDQTSFLMPNKDLNDHGGIVTVKRFVS